MLDVGRFRQARELLQARLQSAPNEVQAHYYLAQAFAQEDLDEEAEEHVSQALAYDPRHFGARWLAAALRTNNGRYPEAEELITGLIRENPEAAGLYALYARLMLLTAHLEKSRALLNEALRLDPTHEEARLAAALLAIVTGNHALANATLEELVRERPAAGRVASTLFYALVQQRRYREAQLIGQQLLRSDPSNAHLLEALVEVRVQTHWASWPVYPFVRWGWLGVAGVWLGVGVVLRALGSNSPRLATGLGIAYLALVIYSWTYTPLLKRWIRTRGM